MEKKRNERDIKIWNEDLNENEDKETVLNKFKESLKRIKDFNFISRKVETAEIRQKLEASQNRKNEETNDETGGKIVLDKNLLTRKIQRKNNEDENNELQISERAGVSNVKRELQRNNYENIDRDDEEIGPSYEEAELYAERENLERQSTLNYQKQVNFGKRLHEMEKFRQAEKFHPSLITMTPKDRAAHHAASKIYSAEEKRALAIYNIEEKQKREKEIINEMKNLMRNKKI